ncbi:MAG: bis(5'-nucleosyl)-tetraphosphatase (symmetrical) YqeK [Bacilli bacterium]
MKFLIFGGAFNPIHQAHINNIRLGYEKLNPDLILLVPDYQGHFKDHNDQFNYHQAKMINLALQDPSLDEIPIRLDLRQIEYQSKRYSIDYVKEVIKEYPQAHLYFMIGDDHLSKLNQWHDIEQLKQLVTFVVVNRDNHINQVEGMIMLNNEVLPYASSKIRNYYESSGIKVVDKYIREYGLYLETLLSNYMDHKRLQHSKNVAQLASAIAIKNDLNVNQAYVAGMLHDLLKQWPLAKQYALLDQNKEYFELNNATVHAYAASIYIAKQLKIKDQVILSAISKHTCASTTMSLFDQLIYTCDMLSKDRHFKGIEELQALLEVDLKQAFKQSFAHSIAYLKQKHVVISPQLQALSIKIEKEEMR